MSKLPRVLDIDERLRTRRVVSDGGCWEWTGQQTPTGYGTVSYKSRPARVHRVAYSLYVGEIPEGMLVCHTCDNRLCFNPEHLFLGTPADNMRDMHQKGRHRFLIGTDCPVAKLTEAAVREARRLRDAGMSYRAIAARLGVTDATIRSLCKRETWRHV